MRGKNCFRAAGYALLALLSSGACAGRATDLTAIGNDSESHFLVCRESSDCRALGPEFLCQAGLCQDPSAAPSSSFSRACSADEQCTGGLSCLNGTCSQPCESASDCGNPNAVCETYGSYPDGSPARQCLQACGEALEALAGPLSPVPASAAHAQCAFLGAGGRCTGNTCRETLSGQCGDPGQLGPEWSCYEDIAAEVFRDRHGALQGQQLCLPSRDGRVGSFEYRRCADSTCAGGEPGCAVNGIVLESQQMALEPPMLGMDTQVSARGEIRLREPLRVSFELLDPPERCEYVARVRFWNIQLFDGFAFLSPGQAQTRLETPVAPLLSPLSPPAIESGYWQVVHQTALGHTDSFSNGAIIEDSEADVQLTSGGERCSIIQQHVGVSIRDTLTGVVNDTLERWGSGVDDTLECTPCGQLGCELACRRR